MAAPVIGTARTGADAANTTTTTVLLDGSLFNDGDTIFIAITSDAGSQVFTAPSGFSSPTGNVSVASSTATGALFLKRKIVKASETFSSPNYSFAVGSTSAERCSWVCFAVSGDGGTIHAQGTTATGSSGSPTIPALDTTIDDCLLLGIVFADASAGSPTPMTPTNMTKLDEKTGTSAGSVGVFYRTLSSTGTNWTDTISMSVSEQWAAVSLAIAPITNTNGTSAITLGALTTSAAGAVAIVGTGSATLSALSVSAVAVTSRSGTGSATLDAVTVSAAGAVAIQGTGSATLDAVTASASGSVGGGITGTGSATLGALTVSADAVTSRSGTGGATLGDLAVSSAGVVAVKGTATVTLDALSVSASGTVPAIATPPTLRSGWTKGSDTGNVTSTTVILPTFTDGDAIYIAVVSDAGSQTFTAPSGFTTLYSNVAVSGSTATMATFYKTGALHSDFDFDGVNYSVVTRVSISERQSWIAWAIENYGDIDVQNSNNTGSTSQANVLSFSTVANNDLVFAIVATDGTTTPHTDAASGAIYSEVDQSSGTSAGSISVWTTTTTTPTTVGALNINLSTSEQWLGVAFAIHTSVRGMADITLGDLTVDGVAITSISGTADITLDSLTTTSTGAVPRTGSGAVTLGSLTVDSYPSRTGTGSVTLDALAVAGTGIGLPVIGGTASVALDSLAASAAGVVAADLSPATVSAFISGSDASNTTSTVVTLPDFLDGDTLYIALVSDANGQLFTAPTPDFSTTPFATLYSNVAIPISSPAATFALFYQQNAKLSDYYFDSQLGKYVIVVYAVIPERQAWIAWAVTGDGGTDEQGVNVTGTGSTATIPAITPIKNNSLIFGLIATDGVSTSHTGASGYTQITQVGGSSAGSLSLWSHVLPTAGTYAADSVSITSKPWLGVSFSIPPTLAGRFNATLSGLTASAAGTVSIRGEADITTGALTTTSAGVIPIVGTGSVTLGALSVNSNQPRTGTAAITLGGLSLSAAGKVLSGRVGNANITLGGLSLSAHGGLLAYRPPAQTVGVPSVYPPSLLGSLFTISIENASGLKLGGGPLLTGIKWSYKQKLSQAGEWSLEVPLSEPRAAFATLKRRVHCYVRRSGVLVWLGGGIIESRAYGLSGDNVPVLTLSGPDLLRELAGVTVKFEVNALDIAPRANNIITQIFNAVPTWSKTLPAFLPEITARFVHESVLNALVATCEKTGAFFWMQPYTVAPRSIVIATSPVASTIVATNMADPLAAERNPNICLISNIERTETSWSAYNRLIVYGAGDGQARLTLASATLWPDGSSIDYQYSFTDPYGRAHRFVLDKPTNTITDMLALADYGQIEQAAAFKEIAPITPNDADMIAAANTLVVAAVNQLVLSSFPTESYRLTVAALRAVVHPGMQIRVIARKVRDGVTYINIDTRLIIQEVDYEIDAEGEKVTGLTVATTWKPEKTGATILSEQIQKLTALEAHPQIGANENTISYREDVDDDYGAGFPWWFSRGTQQINSVTLRYKLESLRSSVKTIGGTASGSVEVPAHSHNLSTHHHDVPNHQHNIAFQPGSGGATVQIFSGGGTPDFGSIVANGIPHTIYVNTNASSGAITSDGNSTITVGGGGNGTFNVNIANAISATYGVFVDSVAPYTYTDLDWTVNSASVLEVPVSLGDGWYEVDITHYLINTTTLRPLAYSNAVAVAVKPTSHAGHRVRVTAQIELRTTIQTLAVV